MLNNKEITHTQKGIVFTYNCKIGTIIHNKGRKRYINWRIQIPQELLDLFNKQSDDKICYYTKNNITYITPHTGIIKQSTTRDIIKISPSQWQTLPKSLKKTLGFTQNSSAAIIKVYLQIKQDSIHYPITTIKIRD